MYYTRFRMYIYIVYVRIVTCDPRLILEVLSTKHTPKYYHFPECETHKSIKHSTDTHSIRNIRIVEPRSLDRLEQLGIELHNRE